MKRTIKLHTGATKVVEDATHKIMTIQEWREEGKRRFGKDYMDWKFECPMCGHIASIRDFKEAGAKGPNCACQGNIRSSLNAYSMVISVRLTEWTIPAHINAG